MSARQTSTLQLHTGTRVNKLAEAQQDIIAAILRSSISSEALYLGSYFL